MVLVNPGADVVALLDGPVIELYGAPDALLWVPPAVDEPVVEGVAAVRPCPDAECGL